MASLTTAASLHAAAVPRVTASEVRTVSMDDVPANRRRGGDIRTLLSPATVGSASGFLGTATLLPGEVITEHWHPYSEEFLFCVEGAITLRLDGEERPLVARSGIMIPLGMRHRLANTGEVTALLVFQLAPLAPRPDLGHVDTELPPGGYSPSPATHAAIVAGAAGAAGAGASPAGAEGMNGSGGR
jgi:quercetin dioxygenase-like cupin family protein